METVLNVYGSKCPISQCQIALVKNFKHYENSSGDRHKATIASTRHPLVHLFLTKYSGAVCCAVVVCQKPEPGETLDPAATKQDHVVIPVHF
jgi:hypothetical protein